ncbi:MAG: M48 family metalloprotease [Elusimicrobia bacterium]|nr:M48 family metalloprotease [Elusimicrobiota bacterium]
MGRLKEAAALLLAAAAAAAAPTAQQQIKALEHNVDQAFLLQYLHQNKEKVHAAPGNVRSISARIVKATGSAFHHKTHLYTVEEPQVNALTSPGGNIFLYKGLIGSGLSDDEIAALLAHEIAHVMHLHWLQRLKRNLEAARLAEYSARQYGRSSAQISYLLNRMKNLSYDREEEHQADATGLRLVAQAGFKPQGMVSLLKKVQALQSPQQAAAEKNPYLASHPAIDERVVKVQSLIDSGQAKPVKKRLF